MGYLEGYESTRMDALVADLLTASPRIYNVYGLCGYSAVSEYLPYGDLYLKTLDDDDDEEEEEAVALGSAGEKIPPEVWTDESILSPDEKLNYALQMAESIQDLHDIGIVHYDLKMDQFLFTSSNMTSIKLNDFNKAHMMMWNEEKKEYCNYDPHETRRVRFHPHIVCRPLDCTVFSSVV
jgi:serine/threonine protein kinase